MRLPSKIILKRIAHPIIAHTTRGSVLYEHDAFLECMAQVSAEQRLSFDHIALPKVSTWRAFSLAGWSLIFIWH